MRVGLAGRAKKLAAEIVELLERLDEEDGDGEAVAYDAVGSLIRLRGELTEAEAARLEEDE